MAAQVHKSGAACTHRIRRSPGRQCAIPDLCRRRFRGSRRPRRPSGKGFAALHIYLSAIIADTAQNVPTGTLDRRYLDNLFQDLAADALDVIRNGAEEMREHENWRAS